MAQNVPTKGPRNTMLEAQ